MRRNIKYGSQSFIMIILFAAILMMVYLSVMKHNTYWDFSANAHNRLDAKTLQIVGALKSPVHIMVFNKKVDAQDARDLLEVYALSSPQITYEIIDPDVHPGQAKSEGIDKYGQCVVRSGEKRETILNLSEESLSNALFKIEHGAIKNVYFLEGHGEKRLADADKNGLFQYSEVLKRNNYLPQQLKLLQTGVPEDADIVAIIAPDKDILPAEIKALQDYLGKGGSLLVALEPGKLAGLDDVLISYGIVVQNDFIIDTQSRAMGADYTMPVVYSFGKADELKNLSAACVFPTICSLEMLSPQPQGLSTEWLAQTSEQSWSETDIATWEKDGKAELGSQDKKGPRYVALRAEKTLPDKPASRMVVIGDADFLTNTYFGVLGNRDFGLVVMNMLAGQGALVNIAAKPGNFKPFVLSPSQATISFIVPVIIVPALVLLAALAVFFIRRKA